jgi:hypothetical protein
MAEQPYTDATVRLVVDAVNATALRDWETWPTIAAQDDALARAALDALTAAGRLLPEGASTVKRVAEALALADRKLAALHYTSIGGLPFVGREHIFGAVNVVAREVGVLDAYVAAALAGGPGPRGEHLSPLELARRNGDIPTAPVPINEESTDGP